MPDPSVTPAPTIAAPSKGRIFLRRLTSSVILWAVVLGALFSGNQILSSVGFVAFIGFLAVTGLIEFYGMVEKRGLVCFRNLGKIGRASCRERV